MNTETKKPQTLEDWIAASPNNTKGNTLVRGEASDSTYYYWNLKPNDPHEKAFCVPK